MHLYLVRHGQTAWNAAGRAQGHTDVSLDETGLAQAQALIAGLDGARISRILSSDLKRSAQTAQPVGEALGVQVEETSVLRERRFGDWEGLDFTAITGKYVELARKLAVDRFEVRAPGGGESYMDLWNRLDGIVAEIFDSRSSTLIVSHGGTCAILLARLLKANLATHRSFRLANASITQLRMRAEGAMMLQRYNDVEHLRELSERTRVLAG